MMFRKPDSNFSALSFPCKLYAMLEDAEGRGFDHVINWQSGGKSFKVFQPEVFANQIMAGYFAQTKFKSFQRQLNIYGWKKVHHGPNKGGYVHKFFVRGQPDLCNRIMRRTSKDLNIPADRRDLSLDPLTLVFQGEKVIMPASMAAARPGGVQASSSGSSDEGVHYHYNDQHRHHPHNHRRHHHPNGEETEIDAFYDFFHPDGTPAGGRHQHHHYNQQHHGRHASLDYAVAGHFRVNTQDLDLRFDAEELDGFVSMLNHESDQHQQHHHLVHGGRHPFAVRDPVAEEESTEELVSPAADEANDVDSDEEDELEKEHSFPFKLHLMLESAERDNYSHVVSWVKGGKAFKVHNNKEFVARVLPIYFDQSKYESFRRQLNLYCFQRVARGVDRGVISHPCFVAGNRDLCRDIKRKQQGKSSAGSSSLGGNNAMADRGRHQQHHHAPSSIRTSKSHPSSRGSVAMASI